MYKKMKLLCIFLISVTLALLCSSSYIDKPKNHPFRLAILMAWIGTGHIPKSAKFFMSSVVANSELVDLLLFHESNRHLLDFVGSKSSNIHVIDLGYGGFSRLCATKMGGKLQLNNESITELEQVMGKVFSARPKWTLEVRPAFGSIFEDYLHGYTHWLYMDMDEVLGDLPAWMELEELTEFHVVTLSTGDSKRIYVRGPFTMVNTTHEFPSLIWTKCSYLDRNNILNYYRFKAYNCIGDRNSAAARRHIVKASSWSCTLTPDEAEFSERVISEPKIRLKIASKSMADPAANRMSDVRVHQIFWIDGAIRFCALNTVCDPTRPSPFRRRMLNIEGTDSISMPLSVDPSFPGMRIKRGERKRVLLPRKDRGGCNMDWTQGWGRCLQTRDTRFDLYLIEKFWFKQEFAFAEDEQQSVVGERAIVHFRSWKFGWDSQLNQDDIPDPPENGGGHFVFQRQKINKL